MKVTGQESFYFEMDGLACNYTMYFPMIFDHRFNIAAYKKSVDYLLQQVPHLKCRYEDHFRRPRWKEIDGFNVESLFVTKSIPENPEWDVKTFYRDAMDVFVQMGNKSIDMEKEPPIKFKVISAGDRTMVVLCIHHSIADGRGSMQVLSTLDEIYTCVESGKEMRELKNYREIPYRFLEGGRFRTIYRTLTKKEDPLAKRESASLIVCTDEREVAENFVSLKLSKEKIELLKERYQEWEYTTNDVIVHKLLSICSKLMEGDEETTVVNVGIAMDNRKSIVEDILTITNYASMCPFYVEKKHIADRGKVKASLQHFKATATGLSFSKEVMLLALFPYAIQKKILRGKVRNMIKELSCKGVQSTNVGEMAGRSGSYNGSLQYAEFIGPAGRYGMPIISMSLYEGELTMYFRRINDSEGICDRMMALMEAECNI